MRKLIVLVLSLSLLLNITSISSANQKLPLPERLTKLQFAVSPFEPYKSQAHQNLWISKAIQELLVKNLKQLRTIDTLSQSDYTTTLKSNQLHNLNPNDHTNARSITRALETDKLIIGAFTLQNKTIQIKAGFFDEKKGRLTASSTVEGSLVHLRNLTQKLIFELLEKSEITLTATETRSLRSYQSTNLQELKRKYRNPSLPFDPSPTKQTTTESPSLNKEPEQKPSYSPRYYAAIHYPGVGVGVKPSLNTSFEFRFSGNSDIQIVGGRGNYHWFITKNSNMFAGLNLNLAQFEGDVSEGDAFLAGTQFGFQTFTYRSLSFSLEMGPVLSTLSDDRTGITDTSVDFFINSQVSFYFL